MIEHLETPPESPSYDTRDPKGWCGDPSRGAAMGRPTIKGTPEGRLVLRRVILDEGGYDRNGTYFGVGGPMLFWCADEGGEVDYMFRARGTTSAVEAVQSLYPLATLVTTRDLQPRCRGPEDEACQEDAQEHSEYCEEHEHLDEHYPEED